MTAVTVVGTGAIGLPMAVRMSRAGHAVTAVDPSTRQRGLAEEQGLRTVGCLADAPPADLVLVMVATAAQLAAVVEQAVVERDAPASGGALWVVTSTVGPDAVAAARPRLARHGVALVDAPVTGGVAGARAGRLTIFAAGEDGAVRRAEPVLAALGTVRRVGDTVGRGQLVKLVNQLLCSVHLVAAAEALAFADGMGLDPAQALELVEAGAGGSWMLRDRGPRMLTGHARAERSADAAEVQSAVDIFVKDSALVADAAATAGLDVPLLRAARERFARAAALGLGGHDDSQVIATYPRKAS